MSEIRVDNIIGETGTDAVRFTKGINVTGIVTATNVSIGSSVTATSFFGSGAGLSGVSAGKLLQVQQTVTSTQTTIGTSGENEIMNVSITPSATSSKVLVCCNMANCYTNGTTTEVQFIIYRDSTEITGLARYFGSGGTTPVDGSPNGMFLDSPNSTSSITYRLKVARVNGSDGYVINHTNSQAKSSITVMEIAA